MFLLSEEEIAVEKDAIIDDVGNHVTYGMLSHDCKEFSKIIPYRCLILLLADRQIDTLRLYYSLMSNDQVVLLLNPDSSIEFIKEYINLYCPKFIWLPRGWKGTISSKWKCVFETKSHYFFETDNTVFSMNDDLSLLLTTSGSTGNPKTVRLSYKNLVENSLAFVDALQLNLHDKGMLILPIFYTYGLAVCHMHFIIGGTVVISNKKIYDPELFAFMSKEKITNFHGVPYVYESFVKTGLIHRMPPSLRLITMGGSSAEKVFHNNLNHFFDNKGVRVFALYGQTEGTTILTKLHDCDHYNAPGCIGVPCRGMSAFIDPETNELCFSGTSVSLGYAYDYSDLDKGDENHGILRTGDVATFDHQGRIYLKGRIKRLIKLRGIRINLDDIESDLATKLGLTCACCGEDNSLNIFIENNHQEEGIKEWLAQRYRISKSVITCFFVEKIPRNCRGKIEYKELKNYIVCTL